MQDYEVARIDLPSQLSLEMDKRCVFVVGLGEGVLDVNPIAKVEAGIIGHVRPWCDNYRVVMRVQLGHAFIFFENASQKKAFLGKAEQPDSAWGCIAVCGYRLGVQSYGRKYSAGVRNVITHPAVAAVAIPSTPVTQPTQLAGAGLSALNSAAQRVHSPVGGGYGMARQVTQPTQLVGTGLSALNSAAQRVHSPVGGGYGMARQVVRVGVAAASMVEDMNASNFTWARANLFLKLQPGGMSRVCSLCGLYRNKPLNMKKAHEDGGANSENRQACLFHCYKLGHLTRLATKRAHEAAAASGRQDGSVGQSDGA